MCFMCDGGTMQEWCDDTARRIHEYGFTLMCVDGRRSSWTYTIGLVETFGHPELVITELSDYAPEILTHLVHDVRRGERFEVGAPDASVHGIPLRVGAVHPTQWIHGRFNMWEEYYGHRGDALQLPALVASDVHLPIGRARGRKKRGSRR
jgi:hypothetical protein